MNISGVEKKESTKKIFWRGLGCAAVGGGTLGVIGGPLGVVAGASLGVFGVTSVHVGDYIIRTFDNMKQGKQKEENIKIFCQKFDELLQLLNDYRTKLNDDDYGQLIVAIFAVGMATANADGNISEDERNAINEFSDLINESRLPQEIKYHILNYKANPPKLLDAYNETKKVTICNSNVYTDMIYMVANCDGEFSNKEKDFLDLWEKIAKSE